MHLARRPGIRPSFAVALLCFLHVFAPYTHPHAPAKKAGHHEGDVGECSLDQ